MRFRKGSRVEVFSFKEAPYGAWRSAEIISGNGHTYSVRYYTFEVANNEAVEERVPRKIIRPRPLQIDVDRWEAGELVEVLDNISWKTATVLEELSGRYYVVRLLGSAEEFTVHKVNLRVRQSWQDDKWVMIGKVCCSVKSSTLTGSDVHQNLKPLVNSVVPQETSDASLRMLKRPSSPCDWYESAESCTNIPKKIRLMEEEGHQHWFASSSVQKVDAAAFKGGKMRVQASVNNTKTRVRQMVRVRSKRFSECIGTGSSVFNGCYDDTDACSVGSCSPISYAESDMPTYFLDGANSCNSDAESSKEAFGCRQEEARWKHSLPGGGAVRSCRPELYTYRSTLRKLFASGPLNWDLETSLTDLRLSLKISTDEHLIECWHILLCNVESTVIGFFIMVV